MNARHDPSYKHLFSSPKMVQHLVEGFIPDDWMKRLDFTTLEKVPASYVSDDLRERADDVLWRVKTDEDWLYLYFLIEFQSSGDPWMAVRMLTYVGLLYQDLILQRILALWIREYLLRDLKPELDVPESYDLGEVTMQFAERIKEQMRQREQSALLQGKIEGRLER
jgi:hypothetical protein